MKKLLALILALVLVLAMAACSKADTPAASADSTSDAVCTYTIHNHKAIYELGYLCALMSEGDELGFIAPMQNAHIIRSIDAFALGAKAANENAKVRVMWVNSWWDAETDKLCAETLISEGVTAMAYYGSTSAALQACQEKGVYCTGFHIDMHDYAPDACMSSFCWNWEPILTKIVERYLAGDTSMDMLIGTVADGSAAIALRKRQPASRKPADCRL